MPQVILLKDVENVGERGSVVDVSKGYLRNFLVPRGLAQPATKGLLQVAEQRKAAQARTQAEAAGVAQEQANALSKTVLTIAQKAGDDGRLFGSVTSQDIVDAVREARNIELDRRKVKLDEPIRTVGTHMVEVEVAEGISAQIKTMVVEQH
jgi:large subunit ribosomal protein L9